MFHFSDPASKQMVVENGATRMLVDIEAKSVDGVTASGPATTTAPTAAPAAAPAKTSDVRVDPFAREGAFFGMQVVNLPNGKPMKKGGVDFVIEHRFTQAIDDAGLGGAFGFDSPAVVAYGVRVGLTNRLSVGFLSSNLNVDALNENGEVGSIKIITNTPDAFTVDCIQAGGCLYSLKVGYGERFLAVHSGSARRC